MIEAEKRSFEEIGRYKLLYINTFSAAFTGGGGNLSVLWIAAFVGRLSGRFKRLPGFISGSLVCSLLFRSHIDQGDSGSQQDQAGKQDCRRCFSRASLRPWSRSCCSVGSHYSPRLEVNKQAGALYVLVFGMVLEVVLVFQSSAAL